VHAFEGLNVIEVGPSAGAAYCGKLLAMFGAEVIKIEPPGGDAAREHGPFPNDIPHLERSGLFLVLNSGKKSITLRPQTPAGREVLDSLLCRADVVLGGGMPADLEALSLSPTRLEERFPSLVSVFITPFGMTGPYREWRGTDLTTAAISGVTRRIGSPGREPLNLPGAQTGYQAGVAAACGVLSALLERDHSGRGQWIDVAEAEVWATVHAGFAVTRFLLAGHLEHRSGHRFVNQPYPHTVLRSKDGYVALQCAESRQWQRLLELLGDPQWGRDPGYQDRLRNNREHADELDAHLEQWLAEHTRAEVFDLCRERDIPCGPVRNTTEVLEDPHLGARGFFVEVDHPEAGVLRHPGPPFQLSESPAEVRRAPLCGEHNEEIYCGRLGLAREVLPDLRRAGVI
jgi:crotonobetainyl-CoA:carnitine CoA-transferase CaiB-like acyl-CoA transferase